MMTGIGLFLERFAESIDYRQLFGFGVLFLDLLVLGAGHIVGITILISGIVKLIKGEWDPASEKTILSPGGRSVLIGIFVIVGSNILAGLLGWLGSVIYPFGLDL